MKHTKPVQQRQCEVGETRKHVQRFRAEAQQTFQNLIACRYNWLPVHLLDHLSPTMHCLSPAFSI